MANGDDLQPPPPYTETDIYSMSGRDPHSPIIRQGFNTRDNISPQSPPSTVDGEIIYTPPLTPRSSHPTSNSNSNSNFNFAPPGDHLTTASATAYFDTRPAPPIHLIQSRPRLVHSITVKDDTSPDSLPYPVDLFAAEPERDITPQDWQSFINYLIPHYHAANNEQVINRKLRAELERSRSPEDLISLVDNTTTTAQAQLDQIRVSSTTTSPTTGGDSDEAARHRRQVTEQTVREWNDGFFNPRGVVIRVLDAQGEDVLLHGGGVGVGGMPGAWDTSFDQPQPSQTTPAATAGPSAGARSRFARFMPSFGPGAGPSFGPGAGLGIGGGGGGPGNRFRFGGIEVEGDRVSIGDRFVADRNGVRIGGIVAGNNGISINGQPMFGGLGGGGGGPPGVGGMRGFGGPGGGRGGYWGWGAGEGGGVRGRRGRGGWAGRGRGGSWGCDDQRDGEERVGGRHGRRGRRAERHQDGGHHHHHHRDRSHSVSSVLSSSSSSSESSIGSLPDYDELEKEQLPFVKDHLLAWLHDPEQPITKERLREFRQKINEAKRAPANQPGGINDPASAAFDQKAMRKEVKALMKEWKDLKKQQTKLRRQLRRERKMQRRAEKRERRNTKREMKRAAREQRRSGRRNTAPGPSGAGNGFPPIPAVPLVPPVPGVPGARSATHGSFGGQNQAGFFGPFGLFGGSGGLFGNGNGHAQTHDHGAGEQYEGILSSQPPQPTTTATKDVNHAPGAWPTTTDDHHEEDYDPKTAHQASQVIYKQADEVEALLVEKENELFKLHETIALEDVEGASHQAGGGQEHCSSVKNEKRVLAARGLEEEIEDLGRKMAALRTEADAKYAFELAQVGDSY